MPSKSLRPEQNERLREIVRDLIAKDFKGSATAAAKALGVTQPLVSEFLSGGRGAGPKLIGSRADWPPIRDEVIATSRRLTRPDVERVAGVSLSQPPERLTVEFVVRLAEALLYAIPYERPGT